MPKQRKQKASSGSPINNKINIAPSAVNDEQKKVLKAISENQVTLIHGPAGTGKSWMSSLYALDQFIKGKFDKVVFTRPCIEAYGENLGYLPGNLAEKLLPYLLPIFNILEEKLSVPFVKELIDSKQIITVPFAFLRGWTFKRSFVVVDEGQNTSVEQMRLFLTRIGEGSKAIVSGDLRQTDIRGKNGLRDAVDRLKGVPNLAICELTHKSIVRSKIVADIEERYAGPEDPQEPEEHIISPFEVDSLEDLEKNHIIVN